jgi:ABC-type branched-subunit amino acid transport system ATPase component
MNNLLVVEDLRVTYGGVVAVDSVSLSVSQGEIVGLIGPNGAGKSSMIDALTGYHQAAAGRVIFDGEPIIGARPYTIARRGLIRTFQSVELFDDLTVEENLLVAAEQPSFWTALRTWWHRRGPVATRTWPGLRKPAGSMTWRTGCRASCPTAAGSWPSSKVTSFMAAPELSCIEIYYHGAAIRKTRSWSARVA